MSSSDRPSKPPKFELEAPFVQELVSMGLDAFDDPAEITKTTAHAAKAIYEDQKSNRYDNNAKALMALLNVLLKMRREQRNSSRWLKLAAFALGVAGLTLYLLDKANMIQFVHH
jgi:hypothetical protein